MTRPAEERFAIVSAMEKCVIHENGCCIWSGTISSEGYGRLTWKRREHYAHRFLYHYLVGPIPAGHDLHHECGNRACANPAHLTPLKRRAHIRLGDSPAGQQSRQTHCLRGHPLVDENLYVTRAGRRQCRLCARIRRQAWIERTGYRRWPLSIGAARVEEVVD